MIKFDQKYFKKFSFSKNQIKNYYKSAYKNLSIAAKTKNEDVKFQFSYNALIKLGIALIACNQQKINSRIGHHTKIIEKISEILQNDDILGAGNQMRKLRNIELYDEGILITKKQANSYCLFVTKIFKKSHIIFKEELDLLL